MRAMHRLFSLTFRRDSLLGAVLLGLCVVLAWDATGLDVPLAAHMGGLAHFPLQHAYGMEQLLHKDVQWLGWAVFAGLLLLVFWPIGPWRKLARAQRWQIVATALLSLGVVTLLKQSSHTSCPWNLKDFGGAVPHVSHWAWGVLDRGAGKCFPAGHAATAFAYFGVFFAMRRRVPGVARWALVLTLVAGIGLGLVQQWRGAHYMSHTLWTAWICWTCAWVLDWVMNRKPTREAEAEVIC